MPPSLGTPGCLRCGLHVLSCCDWRAGLAPRVTNWPRRSAVAAVGFLVCGVSSPQGWMRDLATTATGMLVDRAGSLAP